MKQEFVNVALSQLGYKETGKNFTKYGEWYGINPGAWCAMFVSWCANKANVPKSLIPKYANCGVGRKWFKEKNRLTENANIGDIGFVMKDGAAQHTFIVEYVDGKTAHTIEGNLSDKVKRNTRKIGYNSKTGNGLLFGNVEWSESTYAGTFPKLPSRKYFKKGDKGTEVKNLQKFLNWALDIKLQLDGSYGPITKQQVQHFEKLCGTKQTGLFGEKDLAAAKKYKR